MRLIHQNIFNDHGKGKDLQAKRKFEGTSQVSTKQLKIAPLFGKSLIMDHCVGLAVNSGRPFSIFKDKDFIALIKLSKLQAGDKTEIYPDAVKRAVQAEAVIKRKEIRNLLTGKVISLSLDMATCRHRSFFGERIVIFIKDFF